MRRSLIPIIAGAAILAPAAPAAAQSLAARIAAVPADAAVRFQFEPKPGVCGDGESISIRGDDDDDGMTIIHHDGGTRTNRNGRGWSDDRMRECIEGPVVIELARTDSRVSSAVVRIGGTPMSGATDLGAVDAAAAAAFLLDEDVLDGTARRAAERMIFAATLAPVETWPALLRVARSRRIQSEPRSSAIFWLSNAAGDRVTEGLVSIVGDDSDELEVRQSAVFSISRREADEAVPQLMDIARNNREPEIRRSAMFWLGRIDDPRVLTFFEEILRG